MPLYLETQTVWQPTTEDSATMQVAAILVPPAQESIQRWQHYLNLLMQRVDWMIQQEASQEAAWELMRNAVRRAQLDAIQLPQTAGLDADELPDSTAWAEAMTLHNLEFQELLQAVKPLDATDYLFNFPSPTTSETAAVEQVQSVIQTTTLSEWLELMVDLCRTN